MLDIIESTERNLFPLNQSLFLGVTEKPLVELTIAAYLDDIAQRYPENLAVIVKHQNIRWNYRQYQQHIDELAIGLLDLGIKTGDRVGIWSPNNIEWCLTQFATAKVGAILVCINPAYRPEELQYALTNVGCSTIICAEKFKTSKYLEILYELAPELMYCEPGKLTSARLPDLKHVIRMSDDFSPGMVNFNQLTRSLDPYDREKLIQVSIKNSAASDRV